MNVDAWAQGREGSPLSLSLYLEKIKIEKKKKEIYQKLNVLINVLLSRML
jgi:hypothetical protein